MSKCKTKDSRRKSSISVVPTFTATIYVGLRTKRMVYPKALATQAIRQYVDKVGLCVSITDLDYIFPGGNEPGLAVGLINYPRFPKSPEDIKRYALEMAGILREILDQKRVSIVMPNETIMIGDP